MTSTTGPARGTRALRAANREHVTDLLRVEGPQSRTDLAERLGLARSAVTAIVSDLIAEGVVCEVPGAGADGERPARGRPRVLVGLDPTAARVAAVQVGARWARVALADAAGAVVADAMVDVVETRPEQVVARVADAAHDLARADAGPPVAYVGVCVPGAVDTSAGRVLRSDVLGWDGVDLARLVGDRMRVPVFVQDVTQAATLAEARFGAAAGARTAIVADYGTRIGIGLVLDGRLHRGSAGLAGSVGHTAVFGEATPCRCGRLGCFEAVAGLRAAVPPEVAAAHGPADESAAFADVVARIEAGDPELRALAHRALDRGAHALASLVGLIDPEVLVVTGMIAEFPVLADDLVGRTAALLAPEHRDRVALQRSTLGLQAWVRGSILVALQALQPGLDRALAGADATG
ncbi:MAG: ROK family transcriptional regulator [Actinobacteria bacterium]|nr:ROK family transcriptional regulator [Actinomycetota bacterium]